MSKARIPPHRLADEPRALANSTVVGEVKREKDLVIEDHFCYHLHPFLAYPAVRHAELFKALVVG